MDQQRVFDLSLDDFGVRFPMVALLLEFVGLVRVVVFIYQVIALLLLLNKLWVENE